MTTRHRFRLPDNLEPTRATLHLYARAMGAVALALGDPHPKYWHMSLKVAEMSFQTDEIPLADGRSFRLSMDFETHAVILSVADRTVASFDMTSGVTGTAFGNTVLDAVGKLGVSADFKRDEFENDEPREYDRVVAEMFYETIAAVSETFETIRAGMQGERGPVQLWPHGFDIAFEWFGADSSQINVGFYPAGEAYFYSNPFPFDRDLLAATLPDPGTWYTDGWEGSKLDYSHLRNDDAWADRVIDFANAVHALAAPALR